MKKNQKNQKKKKKDGSFTTPHKNNNKEIKNNSTINIKPPQKDYFTTNYNFYCDNPSSTNFEEKKKFLNLNFEHPELFQWCIFQNVIEHSASDNFIPKYILNLKSLKNKSNVASIDLLTLLHEFIIENNINDEIVATPFDAGTMKRHINNKLQKILY